MITFFIGIVALVLGYAIYGKITETVFGIRKDAQTPAYRMQDGVDFVPLDWKRATLIQFLNIAGTGPIFGAIAGALWGPAAYLWIVLGCIFAGAVHDYFSGVLSMRNDGASISEIVGKYLGKIPRYIMRVFSIILLVLVGTVFITSPAQILTNMIEPGNQMIYYLSLAVIILYYIVATIMPVDKIIGRIYPAFGAALLIMAVGITIMLFATGEMANIPEFKFKNLHPTGKDIFPFLFITIACGAVSGFHATQSPIMARCVKTEMECRRVFYGAMIIEGIVAMIWATAAMAHFGNIDGLADAGSAPVIVSTVSKDLLGVAGGALAVLGVVACPITSGDTAFRSARLTISDSLGLSQAPLKNRFLLAIPLFAIGVSLCFVDFNIIWRYFAWSNQTLATIALWAASAYLAKSGKFYWITLIPATFMTVVVTSYFIVAPEGLRLPYYFGLSVGLVLAAVLFAMFIPLIAIKQKGTIKD